MCVPSRSLSSLSPMSIELFCSVVGELGIWFPKKEILLTPLTRLARFLDSPEKFLLMVLTGASYVELYIQFRRPVSL